jgi:hypothetical protein
MQLSHSSDLSVQVLTWINAELRKEVERRSLAEIRPSLVERIQLPLLTGLSGLLTISLAAMTYLIN